MQSAVPLFFYDRKSINEMKRGLEQTINEMDNTPERDMKEEFY